MCGRLVFEANESRGYNVLVDCMNSNTGVSASNTVVTQCALHHFQYTSQTSAPYYAPAPAVAPYPAQSEGSAEAAPAPAQ